MPWNQNSRGPCPRCRGTGCLYCDWCGSIEAFEGRERIIAQAGARPTTARDRVTSAFEWGVPV